MDLNTVLMGISILIMGWVKIDMSRIEKKIDGHIAGHD